MKRVLFSFFIFFTTQLHAQEIPLVAEEMLESIAASSEEEEDFSDQEERFLQWIKHPVNLNSEEAKDLEVAGLISSLQLHYLNMHRATFGDLVDVYELQAVPGWDQLTFDKIRNFISCVSAEKRSFKKMLRGGEHQLIWRVTTTFEKAKGYQSINGEAPVYAGTRERVLIRYRFNYKKDLQWHFLAEKDPGEKLWRGMGLDFMSGHFLYTPNKFIKKIVVGDYTINLGNSLIHWQGYSVGGDVIGLKPQGETIRAYSGAGEYLFHRGVAATLEKKKWQLHLFASHRKLDGNLQVDSNLRYVTSIQTGGIHRTALELEDKGVLKQTSAGFSLQRKWKKIFASVNVMEQRLSLPLIPQDAVYNTFALRGQKVSAQSFDFTYYGNHYQLFGEVGVINQSYGYTFGSMISVSSMSDIGFRFRHLSKSFSGKDNNTFSKSSNGYNETGLMCLLQIRTHKRLNINASFDVFKFPYFKFRVNGPSHGFEHRVTVNYKPNKQFEGYALFAYATREQNDSDSDEFIPMVGVNKSARYRVHLQWKLYNSFLLRTRMESKSYKSNDGLPEHGVMIYADARYLPMGKPYKISARVQYFNTSTATRIYAYENDLHPGNTIPQVNGKGVRMYITGSYKMKKNLSVSFKIARTIYADRTEISSGNEMISASHKTQAGLQIQLQL